MEQVEKESTYNAGSESGLPSVTSGREWRSVPEPTRSVGSAEASTKKAASQDLSDALDRLLERLPGLVGEDRTKAKQEFLELAAKSSSSPMALVAKSAEVAKRVTGSVRQEWESSRGRAESYIHASPGTAMGIAMSIGLLMGALLVVGSRRH